jgi:hypothetical protein
MSLSHGRAQRWRRRAALRRSETGRRQNENQSLDQRKECPRAGGEIAQDRATSQSGAPRSTKMGNIVSPWRYDLPAGTPFNTPVFAVILRFATLDPVPFGAPAAYEDGTAHRYRVHHAFAE